MSEYSNTAVGVASSVLPSVVGITVNYSVSSLFGQSQASATGSGIILTNDGDFSYKLTHPKHEVSKTYIAEVEGVPTAEEMRTFAKGVYIDGKKTYPAKIRIVKETKKNSIVEIIIHEGRNHQVKKMFSAVGMEVIKLKRERIGFLDLSGLNSGEYRKITPKEVKILYSLINTKK